jgi:hypothetical protein
LFKEVVNKQLSERKIETEQGIITVNKPELKVGEEVRMFFPFGSTAIRTSSPTLSSGLFTVIIPCSVSIFLKQNNKK